MPPKKNNTLLLYVVSVGVVLLAVAITAVINTTSTKKSAADIRARASAANALRFTGVVSSYDATNRTLLVLNLKFATSGQTTLPGAWKVAVPASFNYSPSIVGAKVTIAADSTTMKADTRTVTALEITSP